MGNGATFGNTENKLATIHHFIPATFPLDIFVSDKMTQMCANSWKTIRQGVAGNIQTLTKKTGKTGVVTFFDDFYERLFDRAAIFYDIFPNMRTRGSVLILATEFLLSLKGDDNPSETHRVLVLGRKHKTKPKIRPWHFAVYMQAFLETIMFCLGHDASLNVAEAWTNVCAYALNKMLRGFLPNMVNKSDFYQNCDAKVSDRLQKNRLNPLEQFSARFVITPRAQVSNKQLKPLVIKVKEQGSGATSLYVETEDNPSPKSVQRIINTFKSGLQSERGSARITPRNSFLAVRQSIHDILSARKVKTDRPRNVTDIGVLRKRSSDSSSEISLIANDYDVARSCMNSREARQRSTSRPRSLSELAGLSRSVNERIETIITKKNERRNTVRKSLRYADDAANIVDDLTMPSTLSISRPQTSTEKSSFSRVVAFS